MHPLVQSRIFRDQDLAQQKLIWKKITAKDCLFEICILLCTHPLILHIYISSIVQQQLDQFCVAGSQYFNHRGETSLIRWTNLWDIEEECQIEIWSCNLEILNGSRHAVDDSILDVHFARMKETATLSYDMACMHEQNKMPTCLQTCAHAYYVSLSTGQSWTLFYHSLILLKWKHIHDTLSNTKCPNMRNNDNNHVKQTQAVKSDVLNRWQA